MRTSAAFLMAVTPAFASLPGRNGKIAFASNRGGNFDIWTVNPDGTELTNLTNHPASDRGPSWSPDGQKIAFHSTRAGGTRIFVMNAADGSGVTQLTCGPGIDANATWSPDGTQIAFESNRNGNAQIFILALADLSGSCASPPPVRQLTDGPADHVGPSWSPDGSRIAYGTGVGCGDCLNTAGNLEIHVIGVDGNNDRTLFSEPADPTLALNTSRHPDWSPDGESLVFSSARTGDLELWTIEVDGDDEARITHDHSANQFPYFSPDGDLIVYSSLNAANGIHPATVELHLITAGGKHEQTLITGGSNQFPRWQSLP